MGLSGVSVWQLLIVLLIVALLFGTKRMRNIGSDLGGAIKGFKSAMNEDSVSEKKTKKPLDNTTSLESDVSVAQQTKVDTTSLQQQAAS